MRLSGSQGEADYFSSEPGLTLEEVSATTRQWGMGRLSLEFHWDTILLLLLLATNLLIKTNIRFPGEIIKSLSPKELIKGPGRWIPARRLGLGGDWQRGEGSQQVLVAIRWRGLSGRGDLSWRSTAGAPGGRLFWMTWQPVTPGERVQGEDQGDLTRKITMRCWTRQKLNSKTLLRIFLRNFLIWLYTK